jgi:hypothetical protein
MIEIVLHTDNGSPGVLRHAPKIGVSLLPEAVAASDGMPEPGEDNRGVLGYLSVGDLHGAGVKIVCVSSQLGNSGFHGVSGSGGLLEEHEKYRFVRKQRGGFIHGETPLEIPGYVEKCFDFLVTPLLKRYEMLSSKLRLHNSSLSLI